MAELPSIHKLKCVLQECRKTRNLASAKRVHALICKDGLEYHRAIGNYMVPVFVECGSVSDAQQVFNKLSHRNVYSWTSLIIGYVECGKSLHAFYLYQKMLEDSIYPSSYTLVALLKACATLKDIKRGRKMHVGITQMGFERDVFVGNTLIGMYAKCGSLSEAREVLYQLPVRNVVSWSALIAGYAEYGPGQEALTCFEQMQLEGISPNAVTLVCILKACCIIGAIDKGREIHHDLAEKGFAKDVFVGSALVDMYAKCGSLSEAERVFYQLPVRNVVSWSALIAGYAEHGPGQAALKCFEQMQLEGVPPDAVTFVCTLKACGSIGAIDKGREIHADVMQKGFESEGSVGNTLVDMYAKCGSVWEAQEVFDKLPIRDVVSWTALIAGYAEQGPGQEALKCFEQMQWDGILPNVVTFVYALKACSSIAAINKGREIHADVMKKGFDRDAFVGNTLVDMYAKCGSLSEARQVFDRLPVRDAVSWSAMIQGYGINDECHMAIQCLKDMQEHDVKPVDITFTCLLSACSRARLVLEGQKIFNLMRDEYGIAPAIDHYTCMVDLLAQSGHLFEAANFLENMPCPTLWRALLSACTIYGETELGLQCFQQLVQMNPKCASSYALITNIYASAGRWDDADKIEELRTHAGAKKTLAISLIEVDKKVHEFVVGDNHSKAISAMLGTLSPRMKKEGYVPNVCS